MGYDLDIYNILDLLYEFIEKSKTFIVAEHNHIFLKNCSYIAELIKNNSTVDIKFDDETCKIKNSLESDIKFYL